MSDNALSDDEKIQWLLESHTHERETASRQRERSAHRKRGCAVGMNRKAWAGALRDIKKGTIDETLDELRERIRYLNLWVLTQHRAEAQRLIIAEDLFGGELPVLSNSTRQACDLWGAENKGIEDGYAGLDIAERPFDGGTEFDAKWFEGWQRGQAMRARELGPDTELPKVKKGRPAWSRAPRIPGTERRERRLRAVN